MLNGGNQDTIYSSYFHPDYAKRRNEWRIMRDCDAGEATIKKNASARGYLPQLPTHTLAEHQFYIDRASFYNATGRTIDGLVGMSFSKRPIIELPEGIKHWVENITLSGESLTNFAEKGLRELLTVGGFGILVDHPTVPTTPSYSVDQAEKDKIRPYLKLYKQEDILNWRLGDSIATEDKLDQLLLRELVQERDPNSEFRTIYRWQVRVLEINSEGFYQVRIMRPPRNPEHANEPTMHYPSNLNSDVEFSSLDLAEWEQDGETIIPRKGGQNMTEIPFIFAGARGCEPGFDKPPLLDLANVNISHFRTTADLEHGAFYTALPTPWITGVGDDATPTTVGSKKIWGIADANASVGYLEFTGQGLGTLQKMLTVKEQEMSYLGSRMLTPDKRETETAESAQIHRMGEHSILAALARNASDAIEKALKLAADWVGADTAKTAFRTLMDFTPATMSGQLLRELMSAVQSGLMTHEDFNEALRRGDIISYDRTTDEILADLEKEGLLKPKVPEPPGE